MRLLSVLVLTTPLLAVAACGRGPQENVPPSTTMADTAQVEPIRAGHITVSVSCRDNGDGIGARVRPWRAHSGGDTVFVWRLVPANDSIPTELTPVDSARWPFTEDPITWYRNADTAYIAATARAATVEETFKYRIRIVCPPEADNIPPDTIVIDPLVIIDPSASADTTQNNSN